MQVYKTEKEKKKSATATIFHLQTLTINTVRPYSNITENWENNLQKLTDSLFWRPHSFRQLIHELLHCHDTMELGKRLHFEVCVKWNLDLNKEMFC